MASELDRMVSLLGIYLNDLNQAGTEPDEFNPDTRIKLLNMAQDKVCTLIHSDYLVGLHVLDSNKSLTSGVLALSGLTYDVFHKNLGIMGVKINAGAFAEQINFQKYRELTIQSRAYAAAAPFYYFMGGSIYLLPTTTTAIDIYYMRKPYDMAFDVASGSIEVDAQYYNDGYTKVTYNSADYASGATFTGVASKTTYTTTGSGYVQCLCELDSELRDIIVEYAAYIGFKYGKDTTRAKLAWDDSMTSINAINMKIDPQYATRTKVSREAGLMEKVKIQRETLRPE